MQIVGRDLLWDVGVVASTVTCGTYACCLLAWMLLHRAMLLPLDTGCTSPEQQAAHQDWLADIASFLRAADPRHLISAATEGFFVEDSATMLHFYNPGVIC
jgi:hypothetical protein